MSTIRKIIPFSLYDIPGLEQWLEGQANQGLFPTHLGSWATFEDRGVPGTRFRLDPFANRAGEGLEPTQEKLELYRQAGWEYAFRVGRAYFLFYTTDPKAPDLYTNFESRGLSLERLEKRVRHYRRTRRIVCSFFGACCMAVFFYHSKFDVQPDALAKLPLLLLGSFQPSVLLVLLIILFSSRTSSRDYRILKKHVQY